ncbi:MAG: orotate phosphoribosyltransferase [Rhodospirillaceae bacterium]|jgi:orotate phosphoribosyltransferase|nr:orotate phosphoribosyltransferase [Rhodospirillales bacterium]MBT3906043.1 orotate phosphoribosyltransferase [Rhodospirillaceae bacterium]MBT4699931.1 orotate phosphoribosyltransferase [Rhodospirillaceae bacterium]MBT5036062.1 orotate phosphoribosyltransferase [Rhodospirillaceae bacterium]MBT6220554.1 orotate phosphoribosyltransferase [Rhodospirillaceae bacterium]
MPTDSQTTEAGLATAKALLDIKAVNFRPEEPYILTAGWASPVYIDCRWVISFTEERRKIIQLGVDLLQSEGVLDATDMMAGGETAGIPYAAWLSEATSKPMLYVRKEPKGFGRRARIEGNLDDGKHVLLVEDLATDGGSKLNFVNALREAGATVSDSFVVFYYGVFAGALDSLEEAGITLRYLATWHDVLKVAEEQQSFSPEAIQGVKEFLADPIGWSADHGGKGAD